MHSIIHYNGCHIIHLFEHKCTKGKIIKIIQWENSQVPKQWSLGETFATILIALNKCSIRAKNTLISQLLREVSMDQLIYLYSYSKYTGNIISYMYHFDINYFTWASACDGFRNPLHGGMYVALSGALTTRPPDRDIFFYLLCQYLMIYSETTRKTDWRLQLDTSGVDTSVFSW